MGTSQTAGQRRKAGFSVVVGFFFPFFLSSPDGEADQIRMRLGPSYTPAALGQRHLSRLERTKD